VCKISIIVPIYNVEPYIKECLDSLAAQTLQEIEILMVNDGSTDGSGETAKEYADRWPEKFRYFSKENGALSDARNFAFDYVRGEYIAFVDSDDETAENMFEVLWKTAQESGADVVECEFEKVYPGRTKRIELPEQYANLTEYLLKARVCVWNKLYRTQWLKETGADFPKGLFYEDVCFFCKMIPYLSEIPKTVHLPLYRYRQREGSILNSPDRRILQIHDVFRCVFAFYEERGLTEKYGSAAEYKYIKTVFCSFLLRMLRIGDRKIRREVIRLSWDRIHRERPMWRRNPYLKEITPRNLYLRMVSEPMLEIMMFLIR